MRLAIDLAPHHPRARELDHVGDERRRDHQLDAGENVRDHDHAAVVEIEQVPEKIAPVACARSSRPL